MRTLRLLVLLLTASSVGCASWFGPTLNPEPDLCTDWTPLRVIEYSMMADTGMYPEVAQMVVEWDETCAANAAMLDRPWAQVVPSNVCIGTRLDCWWRGLWR